jgi:hypothetical protein
MRQRNRICGGESLVVGLSFKSQSHEEEKKNAYHNKEKQGAVLRSSGGHAAHGGVHVAVCD